LFGSIGCGVSQIGFAISYQYGGEVPFMQTLGIVWMVLFIFMFAISHGPVIWVAISEIVPGKLFKITVVEAVLMSVAVGIITPLATSPQNWTKSVIFYSYGILMGISFVVIMKCFIETKGLQREQCMVLYSKKYKKLKEGSSDKAG